MIDQKTHKGLRGVVIASALVHVAGVAAVALTGTGRAVAEVPNAVEIKLTRLGKKRPDDYLPRKKTPPPPPEKAAPKPVVDAKPSTAPKPKVPEKASAKDRLQNLNRLSSALDRLKKLDEPEEGSEDGSEFGNTSELVEATERSKFMAEVQGCLKRNFILEGLSNAEVANKAARIELSINGNGVVKYLGMKKGTGNERLDRQIVNAARRCQKVSPTPKSIGNQWASGVLVIYRPSA
ncbi:MAG: energy transducer TonB [Myxococcota bacterium]